MVTSDVDAGFWSVLGDDLGWGRPDYRWRPVEWAEAHGVFLWSKQREILEALTKHRQVAVHAHHSGGKTMVAAVALRWWIDSRDPGKARAFSTAPTFFQVKSLLWSEVGKLHGRLHLRGRCNTTELIIPDEHGNDYLAAWGRKPQVAADGTVGSAFQGVHAEQGVLAVGDEASGLPAGLIDDAEKNLTGPDDRILLISNPDDPSSAMARICRGEIPGWHVIHMDAYDSPNWTGEEVPPEVARSLISRAWAESQAAKYGESSPTYLARVRGMFPTEASDSVITISMRAKAAIPRDDELAVLPRVLGVDIGAGGDWTVCQLRVGQSVGEATRFRTADPEATAADIVAVINRTEVSKVRIDSIGVGWGVAGALRSAAARGEHRASIEMLNVAESASDPKLFVNRRSEMWWWGRELCQSGDWCLAGASTDALEQLSWPRWSTDPKGRIRVEPKEDTISRHGHSPDDADALLMAFYDKVSVSGVAAVPVESLRRMGQRRY